MTDSFISSVHIQKLGHKLQEIRERALFNIISKLENGFVYDNDLARSREILSKLFQWFEFDDLSHEEDVLRLIRRILSSDSGLTLIRHYGFNTICDEIRQVRSRIDRRLFREVDDLLVIVEGYSDNQVPPLHSEVPLSYRSEDEGVTHYSIGPTATPIEGLVDQRSSLEQQMGNRTECVSSSGSSPIQDETYKGFTLKWQPLIASDRHVLESVEQALKHPSDPSALLHSCEFFIDVMLQDFPAEVFLQRPAIILLFLDYLKTSVSSRLTSSIFSCFLKLTKCIKTRIHYYSDPSTYTPKEKVISDADPLNYSPPLSERNSPYLTNLKIPPNSTQAENTDLLKSKQLLLPHYCFITMTSVLEYISIKPKTIRPNSLLQKQNNCINIALVLLDEAISLLSLCLSSNSWNKKTEPDIVDVLRAFEQVLARFGAAIDHFRLEVTSDESNVTSRVSFLRLICSCTGLLSNLIPMDAADHVLPKSVKTALSDCLLDPALSRLYPEIHETIFQFVKGFGGHLETGAVSKYKEVNRLCGSMTSAIKFFRKSASIPWSESIHLAKEAIESLDFHKNFTFVSSIISICSDNLPTGAKNNSFEVAEEVILKLLAHAKNEICEETYKECEKRVIAAIGPKYNTSRTGAPGSQILFLLTPLILKEMILHGLTSTNKMIQKYADNILLHILKCKILVIEDIWNKVVQAVIPALPLLACYASKTTALGRTVIGILDPDTGKSLLIPNLEVLKGNLCLLFLNDHITRDEALSRLFWMFTSQQNSHDLLPRLNSLQNKTLSKAFHIQRTVNLNKERSSQQFYQASALFQVLDMLEAPNVEPMIRRSALTQVSVMVEDPRLHFTFLERNGVETIVSVLESALNENNYKDYVDCVIPSIAILKNLCLYSPGVRQELSIKFDTICNILRGLFVFCSEERVRQDANVLLCLLLFHPFIKGSPSNMDLSLPYLITERLQLPFTCDVHWRTSKHTSPDLKNTLMTDKWCQHSIQIHWNSEWFGGFSELLKWKEVHYTKEDTAQFDDSLHLKNADLEMLKSSSINYGISKCLMNIQNGTSHNSTVDTVNRLDSYIHLLMLIKDDSVQKEVLRQPWESSFFRFLSAPPSTQEDMFLLISILKFLGHLVPIYTSQDEPCWIVNILKSNTHLLPNLLQIESVSDIEIKLIHQELLNLITICVLDEQHYMDLHSSKLKESTGSNWLHIINIVAENLKMSESQHFYNLSYLDCILSCLVHLTSTLGWSNCRKGQIPQEPIPNLIGGLCELIGAFHCGKGSAAADSLMGLSITRHIALILNHLLMELQYNEAKSWELCFISDNVIEDNVLHNLCTLWCSRDIILRASILQLLAGLALSPRAAIHLIQEVKDSKSGNNIWESMLTILLDHGEASIVRENAANVFLNLLSHHHNEPTGSGHCKKDIILSILLMLDEFKFYGELIVILENLFRKSLISTNSLLDSPDELFNLSTYNDEKDFTYYRNVIGNGILPVSDRSSKRTNIKMVITPSLVKNITLLIHNLLLLAGGKLSNNLQEYGIVKMLFRCLLRPHADVKNTKDLAFYCDILEMNTAICVVLSKVVTNSSTCLNTVLHTRDCINVLLSLLNPNIYYVKLPQLVYLRNKLWTEIFILIGNLLDGSSYKNDAASNALPVVTYALNECGYEPFLQTLCESISTSSSNDLQHSALLSLTSLLRAESDSKLGLNSSEEDNVFSPSPSVKTILDTVKTPRSPFVDDLEITEPEVKTLWERKTRLSDNGNANKFENMYFDTVSNKLAEMNKKRSRSEDLQLNKKTVRIDSIMAGAQLCKIILHLYEASTLKNKDKKRGMIVNTLSSILAISSEAKKIGLRNGLMEMVVRQFKEMHAKLSLESVECVRRIADKKRICPVLKELGGIIGLATNFMLGDESVKGAASILGFADVIHKLWVWCCVDRGLLSDALKMLCTYTTDCYLANQSLPLTSAVAGTGPRKVFSNMSLLHEIVGLISKEMDLISSSHDLTILDLLFHLLHNSCSAIECRNVLMKTNLLHCLSRLHPALTKKQKAWESVELMWLEFLITLTGFNEGQIGVAKSADALELVMMLTASAKLRNRTAAMLVLRNIAFCQSNRPRLINSTDFIKILQIKLSNGTMEEKTMAVTIIWALIANSQRAKLILKCAGLDAKLQELIKRINYSPDHVINQNSLHMMHSVLGILKEGEKLK